MSRKPSTNALVFILITIAIDSIGFGLISPVLPALLKELVGVEAAEAANWGGYLFVSYALMNFIFSPALGNLSDRFGRRPVLLFSLSTLAVDYLIMGFAHSIWLLFLGRILSGISGATMATAKAYVADTTEPGKRAQAFGMVGASFGVGFIIGPALGGLLGDIDPRAPFFAAAALSCLNLIYGFFVVPETLGAENRRSFDWQRANPLGAFFHFSKLPEIRWLLVAVLIFDFAHFVYPATWNFHGDARFDWTTQQIGISLMLVGIGFAVVQGFLIRHIISRFGPEKTAVIGLGTNFISFLGFAFATEEWMIYAWIPISALGAVGGPAVNSLMSRRVAANAQGELQGALSSLHGISAMASPLIMTQTFSYFAGLEGSAQFFGAAFLLSALLSLLSLPALLRGIRPNTP